MIRNFLMVALWISVQYVAKAQALIDKEGWARFYSEAPLENIEAVNKKVVGAFNTSNGEVAVSMLMRGFEFDKSLMQEHFNENYVESDKYPKATFKGRLLNFDPELLERTGKREFDVQGDLTIHGVTRSLNTKVQMDISTRDILVETKFMVEVESFDIDIPKVVFYNIAEKVEVTAKFKFDKKNNP